MALERKSRVVEWESIAVERELLALDRRRWNLDKQDHERMVEEERQKRERERQEQERNRAAIVWEHLTPSPKCLRYGTREYSATLAHVPVGLDPLEECRAKPVDIHGKKVYPDHCSTENVCGHVKGYWSVDFNEGACVTSFRDVNDKGCVQPGIHRYDAHLENLQNGDDWREMCSTTPYNIHGHHYAHPTICTDWGRWGIGGIWDVEDTYCP
ncbi:hypothetical protein B0H34DRAFT_798548 [Crassisporium funariophilum]|nr:hypothetical protein B0H34DRAFT_798548 [Crassisporium funariophilum]